jgi:hypothetical protein
MATSSRMGWPYPEENQDPFWDAFVAFVAAQDASVFALKEDRDLLIMAGGTVSFVASSGLLSWSQAIEMNSAVTGFKWTLPAGSVNLNDGDYLYVTLPHNPTTNLNVAAGSGPTLPQADIDNPIVMGLRNGDRIYFRDGKVLQDGQSLTLFSTMPGGGGGSIGAPGQFWRENIALAVGNENSSLTPKVLGAYAIDSDDYTLTGTNKTFTFKAVANVDGAGVSGTVVLWDLNTASAAATLTFNGVTAPTKQTAVAIIVSVEHIYEVRGQLTAGVGTLFVHWAGLQIDNTIV